MSYLIVSVREGQPKEARSWRLKADRSAFDEEFVVFPDRLTDAHRERFDGPVRFGRPRRRRSSTTCARSKPRASRSCARSSPSSSGRSCSTRSARTRRCCCGWRRRRSTPVRFRFPLLHVDTTYKFHEMIEFRDSLRRDDRREAHRAHQHGRHRRRHAALRRRARSGAAACSRRARCSTRSRPATSTRPSAARAATRSGRAPRSASSPCATKRASGIRSASAPSCGTC